jgi:hypothetical protein
VLIASALCLLQVSIGQLHGDSDKRLPARCHGFRHKFAIPVFGKLIDCDPIGLEELSYFFGRGIKNGGDVEGSADFVHGLDSWERFLGMYRVLTQSQAEFGCRGR